MLLNIRETQARRYDFRLVEGAGGCHLQVPVASCTLSWMRVPLQFPSWAQRHPQEMGHSAGAIPRSGHYPRSAGACLPSCPSPTSPGASHGVRCSQGPQAFVEGSQLQPGHSVSPVYAVGAWCVIFPLPLSGLPPPAWGQQAPL